MTVGGRYLLVQGVSVRIFGSHQLIYRADFVERDRASVANRD
jgi:hypothetical protein